MKDFDRSELETGRPTIDALDGLVHCLDALFGDSNKRTSDQVAHGLTYEELLGALLVAQDEITELRGAAEEGEEATAV